jgi:hypothetical protein
MRSTRIRVGAPFGAIAQALRLPVRDCESIRRTEHTQFALSCQSVPAEFQSGGPDSIVWPPEGKNRETSALPFSRSFRCVRSLRPVEENI